MDSYFEPPTTVKASKNLLLAVALLDLAVTTYMIIIHLLRALNQGLGTVSILLLGLGFMHGLTAPAAFATIISPVDNRYIASVGTIAILALIADGVTLGLRFGVDTGETQSFKTTATIGVSIWVGTDVAMIIVSTLYSFFWTRWRFKTLRFLRIFLVSNAAVQTFLRSFRLSYFALGTLNTVWVVDLALTLLIFIIFGFGLNPTEVFNLLILFQLLHLFLFFWYRGVTGAPSDDPTEGGITSFPLISALYGLVGIDVVLSTIGAVWRTVDLVNASLQTWEVVVGGIVTGAVYGFVLLDVLVLGALSAYRAGLVKFHKHREKIAPIVVDEYEMRKRGKEIEEDLANRGVPAGARLRKPKFSDIEI